MPLPRTRAGFEDQRFNDLRPWPEWGFQVCFRDDIQRLFPVNLLYIITGLPVVCFDPGPTQRWRSKFALLLR
jgi:hypothetical protein